MCKQTKQIVWQEPRSMWFRIGFGCYAKAAATYWIN